MTLMSSTSKLATSVDQLTGETNITKAQLDAEVALAKAAVVTTQAEQTATEAARDEAAVRAADAETHLATVKAGMTYQGISAMIASKAVTAVDVFVYDTSLDSDGGAWRKRCQHTSWYNEPLNTPERGARREFPAVAVIVAEERKVTIYDGDDPSLPMWMAISAVTSHGRIISTGNYGYVSSVSARNGAIVAATGLNGATDNISAQGLFLLEFPADRSRQYNPGGLQVWPFPLAVRASGGSEYYSAPYDASGAILSYVMTDVDMVLMADAKSDPSTGLPIPTIAIATDGGICVIKDNGTVVDLVNYVSAPTRVSFVEVGGETKIFTTSRYNNWVNIFDIPDADFNTGPYWPNFAISGLSFGNQFGQTDRDLIIGATNGVVRYAKDPALTGINNISSQWDIPVTAYTTKDYLTGWMVGQTPLATLADIETSILTGGQTVAVRAFDINWTDNGDGSFTSDGTINGNIKFTVNPGVAYRMAFTVDSHTSGNGIHWAQAFYPTTPYVTEPGTYEYVIVPTGNDLWLQSNAWVGTVSKLIVEPAVANRKNTRGLIVNGTITRSPVANGAELVGYSGFSDVNYLEASLKGYLPAGSSSQLCLMGWFKTNSSGSVIAVGIDIPDVFSGGANGFGLTKGWSGYWAERATNVGYTSTPVTSNEWQFLVLVREPSGTKIYSNGVLTGSTGAVYPTSENPFLRIGNALDGSGFFNGAIALLRISATAPTAEQIAKIYEDERKLFQPGAQCTLFGTSDAVTALAHDPKTNLLHVGTSAGHSTFDGLVRVANTETPVGTAISAVNGLIAEQ